MTEPPFAMELEEERIFVVFEKKTGEVVHIHRVLNFRGAERSSMERDEEMALEHAVSFGHRKDRVRVLRVDKYDTEVPQRIDVKNLQLVTAKPRRLTSTRKPRQSSPQSVKGTRKPNRR